MRGKIGALAMLSAFVSLAAFMVQEVDARGGRGGGGGGGGRGGGGFSRGGSSSMSRGGGGGMQPRRRRKRKPWQLWPRRQWWLRFQPRGQLQPSGGGGYSRPSTRAPA